ncbi:MAG: hypothetical protein HYZ54_04435 [Ignavibacteriae bacterium]|nr:hypothetical protein [Ignavibacteriota bacterium]
MEETIELLQTAGLQNEQSFRRIEQLEREKNELNERLEEIQEFEQNREMIQKELARRNIEVNSRINEAQQYKNEIAEIEGKLFEIPKLREEILALNATLETITDERDRLLTTHNDAAEFLGNYENLQSELKQSSKQVLEFQQRKEADDALIAEATASIADLELKLTTERSGQERLHVELRAARDYEEQIARHLGALDEYSSQIIDLKRQKTQSELLFTEVQSAMLAAQAAYDAEKSNNADLSEKHQTLTAQLVTATEELDTLLTRYGALEEAKRIADEKNKELNDMLTEVKADCRAAVSSKELTELSLHKEVSLRNTLETSNQTLTGQIQQSKVTIIGLHEELEKLALAKADSDEKLREEIKNHNSLKVNVEVINKELNAAKKETTVLQDELEKLALAKADAEEKLQKGMEIVVSAETKAEISNKQIIAAKKQIDVLQDELEKLALAKADAEEKSYEEAERRREITQQLELEIREKSSLSKELQVKIEMEEIGANELSLENSRGKEEIKLLRKKISTFEEEKAEYLRIIEQSNEEQEASKQLLTINKSLEKEREELSLELIKLQQTLNNSEEQIRKTENEFLIRINSITKELESAKAENILLKTNPTEPKKGISSVKDSIEPEQNILADKRANVVNKIGDILARLEGALQESEE